MIENQNLEEEIDCEKTNTDSQALDEFDNIEFRSKGMSSLNH